MGYFIDDIEIVEYGDGRSGVKVCDETLKLILAGLKEMDVSLPITDEDWEAVWEYLTGLDAEIGGVEADGIRPTKEYNERVCRAVDEFNLGSDYDFFDYDDINRRMSEMMEKYGKDGVYELDYERWLPKREKPYDLLEMADPVRMKLRYGCDIYVPYTVSLNFQTGQCRVWTEKGAKYRTARLTKRQIGVIKRQISSSGLIGKKSEPAVVIGGCAGDLTVECFGGTLRMSWTSGEEGVDDRFVETIERYLEIVPQVRPGF